MKSNALIGVLIIAVAGVVSFMALQAFPLSMPGGTVSVGTLEAATIYKSPSCGCCGQYAEYMKDEGYGITIESATDMTAIKKEYGVPYELESCHTMEIAGYIVEGHIPNEAVRKLLEEKPDIKGIGMAGMPSGSPGMPGPKNGEFVIYEITHDGAKGDIFMTI